MQFISIFFLFLTLQSSFYAKVIGVSDGDTIIVLTDDNRQIKIRLEGIDCPESHQEFGSDAKQAVVDLCFNKIVKVVSKGNDKYGRMLANLYVDDIFVNSKLIELGMAWHYKKYNDDEDLANIELKAREKKIGLWSLPNQIPPWGFRKKSKTISN